MKPRKPKSGNARRAASNAFDKKVGARIRTKRESKGLSLNKLAGAIGVSPPQMSRYETGTSMLDPRTLALIASELGCNGVGFFVDGIEA